MQEKILQNVWKSLPASWQATLTGGESLEVVYQGQENTHAGPDFLSAILKINDTVHIADVEIHIRASDWFRHGHGSDSAYGRVVLHVVRHNDVPVARGPYYPRFTLVLPTELTAIPKYSPPLTGEVLRNLAQERLLHRVQLVAQDVSPFGEFLFKTLWQACGFPHNQYPCRKLANWLWQHFVAGQHTPDWQYIATALCDCWFRTGPPRAACALPAIPDIRWNLGSVRPAGHPSHHIMRFGVFMKENSWEQLSGEVEMQLYARLSWKPLLKNLQRLFSNPQAGSNWLSRSRLIEWLMSFGIPWLFHQADLSGSAGFSAYLQTLYFELPAGFTFHQRGQSHTFNHAWQYQALHQAAIMPGAAP